MGSTDVVTPATDVRRVRSVPRERAGVRPRVRRAAAGAARSVDISDGYALSALRWGSEPPELVLLHGGAQNAHTWDTVALALDRPLVAIDLPGHGHSAHRDDHVYWPRRQRGRRRAGGARARAGCRARRRHVARRAHRARARRPRARARASARARRRHARREPREVDGDRELHRRTGVLRVVRRDPRAHGRSSTPRAPSRRCGAASCTTRSRRPTVAGAGATTCRGAAAARAKTVRSCPGLDDLWDAVVTLADAADAGARQPVARRRRRGRRRAAAPLPRPPWSRSSKTPGTVCRATSRWSSLASSPTGSDAVLPELAAGVRLDTRRAAHALAEHVVSAALLPRDDPHRAASRRRAGSARRCSATDERVRVDGTALVHERAGADRRAEITTLRGRRPSSACPLGAPRRVQAGDRARSRHSPRRRPRRGRSRSPTGTPSGVRCCTTCAPNYSDQPSTDSQIWPEHFDLACEIGDADAGTRANYGASPGDAAIPQPYLYVGPWDASRARAVLAAYPFGAALTYAEMRARRRGRSRGPASSSTTARRSPHRLILAYAGGHGDDIHPHGSLDRRAVGGHRQGDLRASRPGRRARARDAALARRTSPTGSRSTS